MRLFLSLNLNGPRALLAQENLIQELKQHQVAVTTHIDLKKSQGTPPAFDLFDALVIDGSSNESENGYFLAIALAHKKPVQYLVPKGTRLDPSVEALQKNKDVQQYIRVAFYSPDNLELKVKTFLRYLDQHFERELYSIKYTLRLSPRMDSFLKWKSERTKKNKADYLRDYVNELMKQDDEYNKRFA